MRKKPLPITVKNHVHPFGAFARSVATATGRPAAFILAALVIFVWLVTGPIFGFSDTWQLVINTSTTVITFLMVFLIQNTQNRDSVAVQVKLDELIRSDGDAHNALMDLEELTEEELVAIKKRYEQLARDAHKRLKKGQSDTGSPRV